MGPAPANCWHTMCWTTGPAPANCSHTVCWTSPSKLLAHNVLDHLAMEPAPANCSHTVCWTSPSKLLAHNVLDHLAMGPAPANCWNTLCWTTGPWWQPKQTVGTQCAGPQGHEAIPSKLLAHNVLDHWVMVAAPANCWHTMCWTTGPWWQPQQTVGTQCAGPQGHPHQTVGTQCAGQLVHGGSPSKLLAHNVLDHWSMVAAQVNCWHTMCWTTGPWGQPQQTVGTQCAGPQGHGGSPPANCWHTMCWTIGPWGQPQHTVGTQCAGPQGHGGSPSKLLAHSVLDHRAMGPAPANCWHTMCWTTGPWWQPSANCWHTVCWTTGLWSHPQQTVGTQCAGPLGQGPSPANCWHTMCWTTGPGAIPSKLLAHNVLDHWAMVAAPANCWHTMCWTTGPWWQPPANCWHTMCWTTGPWRQPPANCWHTMCWTTGPWGHPHQTVGTQCAGPQGHGASPSKLLAHDVLDHRAMGPAPANCWHTMCWTTGPWWQPQQTVGTQCAGPQGHGGSPSKLLAHNVLDHRAMGPAPANCWHTVCWTTGPWGQPQQTVGTQCAGPQGHGGSPSKLLAHSVLDHWARSQPPQVRPTWAGDQVNDGHLKVIGVHTGISQKSWASATLTGNGAFIREKGFNEIPLMPWPFPWAWGFSPGATGWSVECRMYTVYQHLTLYAGGG